MQDNQNYFFKNHLVSVNQYFRNKQAELTYIVKPQNHKLDAKLGIAKNFMRLTNKAMIGMNKIHFNRAAIFSAGLGLFCGWVFSQFDTNMQFFLVHHRTIIKKALIQQILRNQAIKNNLNQALLKNVYTNADVQYKLHEILMRKVIIPQKHNLAQLSKTQLIQALQSQQLIKSASELAAKAITQKGDLIAKLALQFLGGQKMLAIITGKVSSLLQSQQINEKVAHQVKILALSQITLNSNKEEFYDWIRQNFINW